MLFHLTIDLTIDSTLKPYAMTSPVYINNMAMISIKRALDVPGPGKA